MNFDVKQVVKFAAGGAAVLLAIIGLNVAARYGTGSHYQGGIALFLFLIAVIFYQIGSARFDGGKKS